MRTMRAFCVAVLLLVVAPAVLGADQMNIVRGGLFYSNPTGDLSDGPITFEPDNAVGLQASYERKFSDLVGINLVASYVNYDVDLKVGSFDQKFAEQPMLPISVNLLFHPIGKGKVDWYIGPGVSYVMYPDADVESDFVPLAGTNKIKSDNDAAFGAQTGVDIKFGDGTWSLNLDVQYLKTSAEDLDIDPINFGAGLAIRF